MPLQRVVTDFGADVAFGRIPRKLKEHHGIEVPISSAQAITQSHAQVVQQTRLKHNQWPQVLAALHPYLEPASVDDKQAPVRAAYRYIDNRSDQLDYQGALAAGLPIGSGEIESAHRYIILERLDIAGAWWTVDKAEQLMSLRVLRENNGWNDYWAEQMPCAA